MANEVKIKLTDEQKAKIKESTGHDIPEVHVASLGSNPTMAAKTPAKTVMKTAGKTVAKTAGKTVAKTAGKTVAKTAGKTVAKTAGKTVAKTAGKISY